MYDNESDNEDDNLNHPLKDESNEFPSPIDEGYIR